MPIPGQNKICEPLLVELHKLGGSAKPLELYNRIASHFPELDEDDLTAELDCGHNVFRNRVQWARQTLVSEGQIDRSVRGVWTLTDDGRKAAIRLLTLVDNSIESKNKDRTRSLVDLIEDHDSTIRQDLLQRLVSISPARFEAISGQLLRKLGFREVEVTRISNDGGIDGRGRLKMGIVTINAAFQCKRFQVASSVGRPEVDAFRGATQGRFDQAIFITTAKFTKQAREESLRPGTIPIIMIDGDAMIDLMIEHSIGTTSRPLTIPQIDEDFFTVDEEAH